MVSGTYLCSRAGGANPVVRVILVGTSALLLVVTVVAHGLARGNRVVATRARASNALLHEGAAIPCLALV